MNRQQAITLWVAVANLALVLAFPPYDYLSMAHGYVPTFGGFHFVGSAPPNSLLNHHFLALEEIVVLINAGIAWLLLRGNNASGARRRVSRGQRAVLVLMAINLVLILLFPPFENYYAITKAVVPSFDGFYFIFEDNAQRQIVSSMLYIELALVLANGGLLWLLFADRRNAHLSAKEKRALAMALRDRQRGD